MTRDGDDGCRWFSEYPSCEWAPALLALEDYGGERVAQALQQTILYQEDGESIARPPVLQQTLDACRIAQRVVDEILEGRHAPPKSRQNLFDRLKEIFNALLFRCYLGALLEEDMVLVYKRTVRYAKREIARLNATSGRYSPSLTTGGDEAEDLAQQAFRLAFSGQRSWPCERLPLVPFLQGTVKKSRLARDRPAPPPPTARLPRSWSGRHRRLLRDLATARPAQRGRPLLTGRGSETARRSAQGNRKRSRAPQHHGTPALRADTQTGRRRPGDLTRHRLSTDPAPGRGHRRNTLYRPEASEQGKVMKIRDIDGSPEPTDQQKTLAFYRNLKKKEAEQARVADPLALIDAAADEALAAADGPDLDRKLVRRGSTRTP